MKHSDSIGELAKALAIAQGEMEHASKDKINPHFRSKYADLGSVWDAIREPLTKNGLSVIQLPSMTDDGKICISTMLLHSSGQFVEASYALPPTKADPQGFGSAITYMKRYALTGMGVAPEDDDGNQASVRDTQPDRIQPEGVRTLPSSDRKAKANAWGSAALEALPTMDRATFGTWRAKYATAVAEVRDFNEALHKRITDAILKRSLELSQIATAAE